MSTKINTRGKHSSKHQQNKKNPIPDYMQSKISVPIDPKNFLCPKCGARMEYTQACNVYANDPQNHQWMLICRKDDIYCKTAKSNAGKVYLKSTPADAKLRQLRVETHHYFNRLYEDGILPGRDSAYIWLSNKFGFRVIGKLTYRHIGEFDDFYCKKAIGYILEELLDKADRLKGPVSLFHSFNDTGYTESTPRFVELVNEINEKYRESKRTSTED